MAGLLKRNRFCRHLNTTKWEKFSPEPTDNDLNNRKAHSIYSIIIFKAAKSELRV